jgi:hypothetical protein
MHKEESRSCPILKGPLMGWINANGRSRKLTRNCEDHMLRLFAILLFLNSAYAAQAAEDKLQPFFGGSQTAPPLELSEIRNYCVYENFIYSIGSALCIGKTGYVCNPTKGNSGFNERGFWTSNPTDSTSLTPPNCD